MTLCPNEREVYLFERIRRIIIIIITYKKTFRFFIVFNNNKIRENKDKQYKKPATYQAQHPPSLPSSLIHSHLNDTILLLLYNNSNIIHDNRCVNLAAFKMQLVEVLCDDNKISLMTTR